jgi:hypothetical protein
LDPGRGPESRPSDRSQRRTATAMISPRTRNRPSMVIGTALPSRITPGSPPCSA